MAVKLNRQAFNYAKQLVNDGRFVFDQRDAWSEHRPSTQEENGFIERNGINAFARWHLGINDQRSEDTKGHFEFPYGDFRNVHRCGVISAESRAGQYKHFDIENAAAHLHGMIDARASSKGRSRTTHRSKSARAAHRATR